MKKLTIGIDASRAVRLNRTGTENYSAEVIDRLVTENPQHDFILYAPNKPSDKSWDLPNVSWKIIPPRRLWSQIGLAGELKKSPPDVLFVPSHVIPALSSVPSVVTIHGLEYEKFPNAYKTIERKYMRYTTGVSTSKAKRILVPSENTKRDLLERYPASENKIAVTPLGYDNEIYTTNIKDTSPYDDRYLFFVGRIEERKNVKFLVQAYALLAKEKNCPKLVLAGKPGVGYEEIQKIIDSLPLHTKENIIQTGYMSNADAARHMRHASCFVFPSLYEGFGIPVLEAFASGAPVVCSSRPCLPEIAADAAIMLDVDNPLSWAAAISRVINQPDVANKMTKLGLERAKQYSWKKTAELTMKAIIEAADA